MCRCGSIVDRGLCDRCRPVVAPVKRTETTKERGYGNDWRTLSEREREKRPLCEVCEAVGRVRPSESMHHVDSIKSRPDRRMDSGNLIAVCDACHAIVEGMDESEVTNWIDQSK